MADLFRWFVLILDFFALGTLLALWDRIGRFVLPKSAIRLFLVASVLFLLSIGAEVWERFGQPFHWRSLVEFTALGFYVAAMIELYRWFGTENGRKQRHDTINEFYSVELHHIARAVRALEDDPKHVGRYVEPTWLGRLVSRLFVR